MTAASGLIAGRFRLEGLLGSGGTASVFAATDTVLDRPVAIKLLHPHLSESAALREAFLDEARRTAGVAHPGIVEVVDVGTFQDGPVTIAWIAQERLDGATLAEHVQANGPLGASATRRIGVMILQALEAAHAVGLVHRDVSPANVLVRFDGPQPARATLLDFGLADAAGRTTRGDDVLRSSASASAGVVGNAQYASPEQLRGEPVGVRGDLYQVGGLLYFALTGRAPFEGGDRDAVVQAQLHAPPPVASVRARGVSPALDRVLVRAMLKDPAGRFADAAEMRAALEATAPASAPAAATRVLRPVPAPVVATSTGAVAAVAADDAPPGRSRGEGPGWAAAIVVVALLALAAVAVPLMASAGRTEPGAAPTATAPSASTAPSATSSASPTPTVDADVAVPDLRSLQDTLAAIQAAGLVAGPVTTQDSPLPAGAVLSADPAAGTPVPRGTTVRLVVASGTNAIPPIDGWTAADADAAIRAAGFTPEAVPTISDRPAGTVIGSAPAAGASAQVGSTVRLLVSSGRAAAPTPTPTATPTTVPTPTPTPTPGAP
ncbi:serine/threonine protein kinase [Microbacterium sp. SLBN-111]|uniref:serine/threonine protein kinase n=1 Tax=Microbacterium sp. SLBN-111 TaxID=3377733 RepID=UPI003C7411D0